MTFNKRVHPGTDPLVVRTGDRVRIRVGNPTMTNHPINLHGTHFEVAGTDGGRVPKSARWLEVSISVDVGQVRAIEFDALAGDRALHCHKAHHTMNAVGHDVRTMVGVDQRGGVAYLHDGTIGEPVGAPYRHLEMASFRVRRPSDHDGH